MLLKLDIYDDELLKIAKENYANAYCPKNMKVLKSQDCFGQYHYYHSILYSSWNSFLEINPVIKWVVISNMAVKILNSLEYVWSKV